MQTDGGRGALAGKVRRQCGRGAVDLPAAVVDHAARHIVQLAGHVKMVGIGKDQMARAHACGHDDLAAAGE